MTDEHEADHVQNRLIGKANNVVQAGYLHGDVHFHHSAPNQLDSALRDLSSAVRSHWRDEAARRGLLDPAPLAVSWRRIGEPIADHAINIEGSFSGRADDLASLAASFRGLPRRRLVVLGEGGSGKTTLAILLVLALLKDAEPGDPIPAMVSIASWAPEQEHLHTWLIRRLEEDYPGLRRFGRKALEALVAERRIMPVLDGLDEIPRAQQVSMLTTLNRSLTVDDPLVLTCRTREYAVAVHVGDVLSGAAIVHADPVSPQATVAYLHAGTPPYRAYQWRPVFDQIRNGAGGPVAEALTSPLVISLARAIYARSGSSPAELLDTRRFRTGWAIEHFLLGVLVPSSYEDFQAPPKPGPKPAKTRYEPGKANRWLTFLAHHLYVLNTRDFAWWQLKYAVPRLVFGLAGGFLAGFILLSLLLLGLVLTDRSTFRDTEFLFQSFTFFVGGLVIWSVARCRRPKYPHQITMQPNRYTMRVSRYVLRVLFRIVLVAALFVAFVVVFIGIVYFVALVSIMLPLLIMVISWGILTSLLILSSTVRRSAEELAQRVWLRATRSLWVPVVDLGVTTPQRSLRSDRIVGLSVSISIASIMLAIYGSFTLGLLAEAANSSPEYNLSYSYSEALLGLLLLPMIGITIGTAFVLDSAWWNFVVARLWLGLQGHLPLRLMRFLDDACERQVLRQSGTVYQFRHARLHDRLLHR
ncbi:NACHT domain-containing protein [Saccharopolyspora sp. NPDC050389]|uniref:NACHT domain-containing protein n=1 Tax=Saccharopolyspora sp. NPDC050389 TaxID=3155516 RepID=UPI0033E5EA46